MAEISLKEKKLPELKSMLLDLRKAQLNLRFRKSQGNLEKPVEMRKNRIAIARIKTQMSLLSKMANSSAGNVKTINKKNGNKKT